MAAVAAAAAAAAVVAAAAAATAAWRLRIFFPRYAFLDLAKRFLA